MKKSKKEELELKLQLGIIYAICVLGLAGGLYGISGLFGWWML